MIWLQIADLNHKMHQVRNKELSKHGITSRQMHILRLIEALGEGRISVIAKATERRLDEVSRQAVGMEKDGLIKEDPGQAQIQAFKT